MVESENKYEKDQTAGADISVACLQCKRDTKHSIVSSYDGTGSAWDRHEGWSVDWTNNYQLIQCKGCEAVSFRHLSWFSEDSVPETGESGEVERLYPIRAENALTAKDFLNVPASLRRIYREVIDAFNNESSTLCAAGLRAIVEGICDERGITDGPVEVQAKGGGTKIDRRDDLAGKIAGLAEKGFLTITGAQTLHEHRFMGNAAVHQLDRPPERELKLAIEIVEHIFEHLYEIPYKASTLRTIKEARKK
ncbi:DUF4145 domain-containing protein [Burkholderia vietnamiensis]|uniref:DUF4145 domain-containing protein n=1 Tax=Burkholderia vietnamiensis TaxID=60552 RepID=UPI0009BF38FC|nr:DUF4145 domain-containing protein [Burkholderia vietnamiensis]MBR8150015.1 DUF4145 domain-containing protein [Burkholderia vietnamiensis]